MGAAGSGAAQRAAGAGSDSQLHWGRPGAPPRAPGRCALLPPAISESFGRVGHTVRPTAWTLAHRPALKAERARGNAARLLGDKRWPDPAAAFDMTTDCRTRNGFRFRLLQLVNGPADGNAAGRMHAHRRPIRRGCRQRPPRGGRAATVRRGVVPRDRSKAAGDPAPRLSTRVPPLAFARRRVQRRRHSTSGIRGLAGSGIGAV